MKMTVRIHSSNCLVMLQPSFTKALVGPHWYNVHGVSAGYCTLQSPCAGMFAWPGRSERGELLHLPVPLKFQYYGNLSTAQLTKDAFHNATIMRLFELGQHAASRRTLQISHPPHSTP